MNSITYRPVIYAQYRKKDGTYPIRIRVTFSRASRFISTNLIATPSQLTKSLKVKDSDLQEKIDDIIREFRRTASSLNFFALQSMTIDDVVAFLLKGGEDTFALDFPTYALGVISTKGKGAKNYHSALNSLSAFIGREHYDISVLSSSLLHRYEQYLRRKHGENARAVSLYLSAIAHIHTAARKEYNDEEMQLIRIRNPFSNYTVPTQPEPHHRNAPPALLNLMLHYRSTLTGRERLGVDVFLISFALMGANAPDLYDLTPPTNGILTYERTKTRDRRTDRALMKVRIEPSFAWLLDEYRSSDPRHLFIFSTQYSCYENFSRAVNLGLHLFEQRLGLQPLTLYVNRHTWATVARTSLCGIDKSTVNDCLIHLERGMRVTDIYAEKDWTTLWDANKKVQSLFAW